MSEREEGKKECVSIFKMKSFKVECYQGLQEIKETRKQGLLAFYC